MTLLEKAKELGAELNKHGRPTTCPFKLGLESLQSSQAACRRTNCQGCWDRGYVEWETKAEPQRSQEAKADAGKLELDLVPWQIVRDVAQVRMYGNAKYGDPDNWKTVELRRYINALLRHLLAFLEEHSSKDEESGIEHYKHMACNMAFICEMMK